MFTEYLLLKAFVLNEILDLLVRLQNHLLPTAKKAETAISQSIYKCTF